MSDGLDLPFDADHPAVDPEHGREGADDLYRVRASGTGVFRFETDHVKANFEEGGAEARVDDITHHHVALLTISHRFPDATAYAMLPAPDARALGVALIRAAEYVDGESLDLQEADQ